MKEGWEYKKLGEVCEKITDGSHNPPKSGEYSEFLMLSSKNVFNRELTFDEPRYLTKEQFETENKRTDIKAGDVLLTIVGTIGRCCVVKDNVRNFVLQRSVAVLKPNTRVINSEFLMYQMIGSSQKLNNEAKGIAQKGVYIKQLVELGVAIPPLSEQQAIVEELDLLNAIIDKKKEELEELDKLAQSLFYDMFGDPVENEKGWEVKTLSELSSKIGDGLHGTPSYVENSDYYFVNGNNLEKGSIVYNKKTKQVSKEEYDKYYIEFGKQTIFVSINGTIGKLAYYRGEQIILGKSACYINLKENVDKVFIYSILSSDYFKKYTMGEKTGSTISNVSLKSIRFFPVPLPPLPLQQEFTARISSIEQMKEKVTASMAEVQTLLAATMDKYFG